MDLRRTNLPRIEANYVNNASRLQDGDIVVVDASEDLEGVGKSVEISGVGERAVVAGLHTIACRSYPEHWAPGFKSYLQFVPSFKSALKRVASGISVYAVSKQELADVQLSVPSVSEQVAIAEVLADMDAEIFELVGRKDKTLAIKQGMMQQLLTGRIRLCRITTAVAPAQS